MSMKGAGGPIKNSDGDLIVEIGGVSWQNVCQGIQSLITQIKPPGTSRRTAGILIERDGKVSLGCGQHHFVFLPSDKKGEFHYEKSGGKLELDGESSVILSEFVEEYKEQKKQGLRKTPRTTSKK